MNLFPSRAGAAALALATIAPAVFVSSVAAQTSTLPPAPGTAASPAAADQKLAAEMVHTSNTGRHLAPHDTFYLLSYVAVKTANGVEGFDPGQEVHLVEARRATHTLVVTDGRAQVVVPPSKLTNDMDIAAAVRQKDDASQARVTAYIQSEQTAYDKAERVAADATAKDLEHHAQVQQQQAVELRKEEQAPVAQTAEPVNSSVGGDGFYGYGGYGYGSPYSYLEGPATTQTANPNAKSANPATAGTAGANAGSSAKATNPANVGTAGSATAGAGRK